MAGSTDKRAAFEHLQAAAAHGGRFPTPAELDEAIRCRLAPGQDTARFGSGRRRFDPIPILGTVSAGYGDPAEPAELGNIPVDLEALDIRPNARTFALKVRGDSMIDAQIANGDVVIIEAREPRVGDIVAALIDGQTTLKRFMSRDGELYLRAENPKYPDLIPLHGLTIQGVMRAVVRVCERAAVR